MEDLDGSCRPTQSEEDDGTFSRYAHNLLMKPGSSSLLAQSADGASRSEAGRSEVRGRSDGEAGGGGGVKVCVWRLVLAGTFTDCSCSHKDSSVSSFDTSYVPLLPPSLLPSFSSTSLSDHTCVFFFYQTLFGKKNTMPTSLEFRTQYLYVLQTISHRVSVLHCRTCLRFLFQSADSHSVLSLKSFFPLTHLT